MPLPSQSLGGGTTAIQIPDVPSVRPQIDSGFDSLGRGIDQAARGLASLAGSVQQNREEQVRTDEILARRDSDKLFTDYATQMNGMAHGSVDADGNPNPGWDALKYDSLDSPDGGASKRLSKAQQAFIASPGYAQLSPRAKALFDSRAQAMFSGLSEEAVKIDSRNAMLKRGADSEASAAASLSAADAAPLDDDAAWQASAQRGAADAAVMRMGTEILNPEALYAKGAIPDAASLRFRNGDAARAVFDAESRKALDSMTAARAARMVNAAKAEPDPDTQEAFLKQAESFATAYADEKTRAAVASSSEAIRADALKNEKLSALDALASGETYVPGDNPRRQAALDWAQPKIDSAKRQEASRQATVLGREMRSNAAFLASSLSAGVWVDPNGDVQPLDLNQRRQTALDALDKGLIDIPHYQAIKSKLDDIEKSGRQADYEQISADVAAAIAPDVKTVFQNGTVELSAKEKDPNRSVLKYTVEEKGTRRVPVLSQTGSTMGFMGAPSFQATGETREIPVVVSQKKELLARDIPRLITLLMDAKKTQGMAIWRDLDGNPVKKPIKSDFNAYKEFLLNDFTDRQTALDLDAKAGKARDAIAAARQAFGADEATVLRKAASRPPLPSASEPSVNDEDTSLWP